MIPFTLIGGYLGAGKTTLLNHILASHPSRRIALLVNDFGAINIDASLIESRTDKQINLANGCVCCTLSDGFHEAIESLLATRPVPEHIIVEASGVANIRNLSQYGYSNELVLEGILVVADAETVMEKARDKYVATTVQRQLAAADVIILNKTDLVSDTKRQAVMDWLEETAPQASVFPAAYCRLPLSLLTGIEHGEGSGSTETCDGHEAIWVSWNFQSAGRQKRENVMAFLSHLDSSVIRLKGIVELDDGSAMIVQAVGRRIDTRTIPEGKGTRFTALGITGQFNTAFLDRLAREYLEP